MTKSKTITLPTEVLAAVVLALTGIDHAVNSGELTDDTLQELLYLRPYLQVFIDEI